MARKTQEEFVKEVYDLVGDEYTVLDEYKTCKDNILLRHNTCGYEWLTTPNNFLHKKQICPICRNILKSIKLSKSKEQFEKEFHDLVGDEYTVLGEYIKWDNKILLRHNKCGYEWEIMPTSFINSGTRCPNCKINHAYNTEEFKKKVYDLVGDEYTVLGEYKTCKDKILLRHNTCGHEWSTIPSRFIAGSRCPNHKRNLSRKTQERFEKEVYDLVGDEYTVLGEYINGHTKIGFKHNPCGNIFYITPLSFLRNSRCQMCIEKVVNKTTKRFKKDVYEKFGDEYTVLGEHKSTHDKVLVRHNPCGTEYYVDPSNFLRKTGYLNLCPNKQCKKERLEERNGK